MINSEDLYSEFLIDIFGLDVIVRELISEEKAINIRIMLNNLLRDIERTLRYPKHQKKPLKSQTTVVPSNKTTKQIRKCNSKLPFNFYLQNAQSISEIVKLCTNMSSAEKKFPSHNPYVNSIKSDIPRKLNQRSARFDKPKDYDFMPYDLNLNLNNPFKIFILSALDALIKSHSSTSDRRLRAIANKMNCKIDIHGPFKDSHFTTSFFTSHEKITYHCVISSAIKSNVDKCHKCIKDTFPTTTIREISPTQFSAHS